MRIPITFLLLLLSVSLSAGDIGTTGTIKTITLRQGVNGYNGTSDTTIYEDFPDNSNGAGIGIYSGVIATDGFLRRGLIRFDLTSMPPEIQVTSARLILTKEHNRTGLEPYSIHRVLKPWGEGSADAGERGGKGAPAGTGDATWTHNHFNEEEWTTGGGDFVTSPSAVADVNITAEFSSSLMIDDINQWLADPSSNNGWIIRGNEAETGNAKSFVSSEGNLSVRPLLEIEAIFTDASETFDLIVNNQPSTMTLDANADSAVDSADLYLYLTD